MRQDSMTSCCKPLYTHWISANSCRLSSVACIYQTHGWDARGPGFETRQDIMTSVPPSVFFNSSFSSLPHKNTLRVRVNLFSCGVSMLLHWLIYIQIKNSWCFTIIHLKALNSLQAEKTPAFKQQISSHRKLRFHTLIKGKAAEFLFYCSSRLLCNKLRDYIKIAKLMDSFKSLLKSSKFLNGWGNLN